MNKKLLSPLYEKANLHSETLFALKSSLKPLRDSGIGQSHRSSKSRLTQCLNGADDFQKRESKDLKTKNEVVARPLFPPEELHKIVALATCPPEEMDRPINRWTITDLTKEIINQKIAQISRPSVWRLLDQVAIKPHKWVYWLNSPDDDFEAKMLHIVDLYLHPPEDGLLFCLDEKTGIQALERQYPDHPTEPGKSYRREHSYVRHGTQDLLAAFQVSSGDVFAKTMDGHSSVYWESFLKELVLQYPDDQKFHFIQDNYSTHSTPGLCQLVAQLCNVSLPKLKTQADRRHWLMQNDKRIVFHYLPTHASWLNQIEIWFSTLTRKLLNRLSVCTLQELKDKIVKFIEYYNDVLARPYKWTYTGKPLAV
jgi:transposase